MKNKIATFLILTFLLGLTPSNFSQAITQNQINAEVQIVCPDGEGNWSSGSGTIIDSKGIILTNRHVVQGITDVVKTCFIGFVESISKAPDFGTQTDPNFAEVKYYTTTDDMDAAILYLNNPTNKTYPYVNIWDANSDNLKFGDKIEVIGFPSIGGSTITYTSGDFSGFGSAVDGTQNYIKTIAPIEHGNSGGGAYNPSGQFVGIPTMVVAGSLNSIGYVLSVNSIKSWLSGVLGGDYEQEVIEQKPIIEKPVVNIQNDIIPPTMFSVDKIIFYGNETGEDMGYNNIFEDDSSITIKWPDVFDEDGVDGYYVYFGINRSANPVSGGVYIREKNISKVLDIPGIYFVMISARDKKGNISSPVVAQYNYKVYPEWITNNPMQYLLVTNRPTYFYIYDYSNGIKGKLLKEIKFDSSKVQNITVASNNILIEWNGVQNKDFITTQEAFFDIGRAWDRCGGPAWKNWKTWQANPNDTNSNEANIKQKNWDECIKSSYIKASNNIFTKINLDINKSYNFEYNYYFTYENHINELGGFFNPFILTATKKITYKEKNKFTNKLNGQIILQVESKGEAYYINPDNSKRYFLGRPKDAFEVMRKLGLGVKHDFITSHVTYPNNVLGKILLDVEDSGKAYYIYPKDKKAYYLGRPEDAFKVMRDLGLGITNSDLNKIPEGSL
jgi:hypothetical protein